MNQPKVSVIIPVYNTEQYLRQCLDSVVNQTLKDIEIICVDDGSTDGSLSILKEYEQKDLRVKVLTQKNRGAGVARNAGMDCASGKYYAFLDADDFFDPELLELQYRQCEAYGADIGLCGADMYDEGTKEFGPAPWLLNTSLITAQPFSRRTLGGDVLKITRYCPWTKLFSAAFVREKQLRYQALPRANDAYFVMSALALAGKMVAVDRTLVHYRTGMTTNLQANNHLSPTAVCQAFSAARAKLQAEGVFEAVETGFGDAFLANCLYNLRRLSDHPDGYGELLHALKDHYLEDLGIVGEHSIRLDAGRFADLMEKVYGDEIRLSVIVPVYNTEKYLPVCLDSILSQTLRSIEVICVDDGSGDGSLSILKDYAAKDKRIRIVEHGVNKGLFAARNTGIKHARGKYILHVDSDDYLEPHACEKALGLMEEKQADILQFSCGVDDYSGDEAAVKWLEKALTPHNAAYNGKAIREVFFVSRLENTSLVGKVFSSALCRRVSAVAGDFHCYVGEDIYQFFFLAYFARRYEGVKTEPLYWYRRGLGISNNDAMPLEKFELYCKMAQLCERVRLFLDGEGTYEENAAYYKGMSARMLTDCCRLFRDKIAEPDKSAAGRLLLRYWRDNPVADEVMGQVIGKSLPDMYREYANVPQFVKPCRACVEGYSPLVSVIIPVYNVEDYLRQCLDSIVGQTLTDIEIICVNDGSWDDSLSIMEAYREKDPRVATISQANAGLSAVRNTGMRHAHGKYVYFIDSDDYLDAVALENLTRLAEKESLDVLRFGIEAFYESQLLRDTHPFDYHSEADTATDRVLTGVAYLKDRKDRRLYITSACVYLLRRDFLLENRLTFKEGIIHEDNLFSFRVFMAAERVMEVSDVYYHRRVREDSIVTKAKSAKNVIGYFSCAMGMLRYALDDGGDPLREQEIQRAYYSMLDAARRDFGQVSSREREKVVFANAIENDLFRRLVVNAVATGAADFAESGTSGASRALTWLPRKIRGGVRCLREHGLAYTIDRALYHLRLRWLARKLRGWAQCLRDHGAGYTFRRCLYHLGLWEDEENPGHKKRPLLRRFADCYAQHSLRYTAWRVLVYLHLSKDN